MERVLTASILFVLAFSFALADASAQDARQSFAVGTRAFEEGDYLRALAHFQDAQAGGNDGLAVHYNMGVCHYRLGDYEEAAAEFTVLAERYPEIRPLAQYNLGLVRLKQARDAEAQQLFESARLSSTEEKLTRLAELMLRRTDPSGTDAEPLQEWVRLVDFNIGHDDNVALIDEASLPAGQSVDSAFTEMVGVFSGPISASPGFRFDGSAYAVRYSDAETFNQTAVRLGGAYHWNKADWRLEAGPHFNYSTLDGDGFEQRVGAGFSLKRNLAPMTVLGIQLIHDEVDDIESRFAFVEGSREQIDVSFDRYGTSGRLTFGYQLELNDRQDPGVSPTRNSLSLRHRYSMNPQWATDLRIRLRNSAYDDLLVTRDEDLVEVRLGVLRNFTSGWQVNGEYRWSENDSNNAVFSYTRSRFTFGITKNF